MQLAQTVVAPRWRFWHYSGPALVLGCSQHGRYAALQARPLHPPLPVLMRESGGGAVLAGPWLLGLSLVLPANHSWLAQGLLESYRHIGQLHATALGELGMRARSLPPAERARTQEALSARGLPVVDWACFGQLSPWEVVDDQGRKYTGLAQRRTRTGALLVAGTLVSSVPWGQACELLGHPWQVSVMEERTVSGAGLPRGALNADALAGALRRQLEQALGVTCLA